MKCYLSFFVLELILPYCFTCLIKICLTPLVCMSSGSVGKTLTCWKSFEHFTGVEKGESPIVLSASSRVVALLGNAVVSGRK